ncbi:MAG: glycosyltransferase, partial [Gemmobacter sp.]
LGRQAYPHWRLWVNAPEGIALEDLTRDLPQLADRVAPMADHAASDASGFVLMLRAGDVLSADGLLGPLLAVDTTGAPAFVYADDRRPDPLAPGEIAAFHKPGWSPDLLMSQNYIGRAWLASAALLRAAGFALSDLARLGEYGAVLRLSAMAARLGAIRQVPILMLETSAIETPAVERKALQAHLRSEGGMGRVRQGAAPFLHRIERTATSGGKVSIIIPSIGARDHILRCIDSIRKHSGGAEVEIVVVDNIRRRKITAEGRAWKAWFRAHADVVVEVDEPFNWSRLNNLGAAAASGDFLLFLNDDVEVLHADWLDVLMAEAARPEVGVVGAQLLYPDGKVQHAGMFLSRAMPGSARHAFRFAAADDPCYFGLALSQRELTCVTGACMMVRREVFDAVAGFDEAHAVVNNDIDFCLRLRATGRSVIFTPHARLLHHELASRAHLKDDFDRSAFLQTWGDLCLAGDPYVSPSISTEADDFAPEEEPLREVYPGHPLGAADQIRRILVVKLDHIGDLVTALPAIRQLKAQFPKAHLSALVGRSALGIASMEDAIDELIPFEFFDARSGLGRKKLTRADYAALERDLTARQFDLAVDLRKHADTRHILQISGAPLTAGFDNDREFPWLDIALGWERDTIQADKRNHVATDLMNLIGAIGSAFATSRRTIVTASDRLPPLSEALR